MTITITEIHRTSTPEVGFLEGEASDGLKVYVRFKYGYLSIYAAETLEQIFEDFDERTLIFEKQLADGGYHITDRELVEATNEAGISWPQGFGA